MYKLENKTVKGLSPLTINKTAENKMKVFPHGYTYQETRSGKNLLKVTINVKDVKEAYKYIVLGDYEIVKDQTYTISFNTNNNSGYVYPEETYFSFVETLCDGNRKKLVVTAKTTASIKNTVILKSKTATSIAYNLSDIQLEKGSTETEYEEFGAMPSPDYPSRIRNVGDNINRLNLGNETFTRLGLTNIINGRDRKSVV